MKKCLKDYIIDYEKDLNVSLMNKEDDAPLVDYIIDSWKSLEVVPQIQFDGYEYTEKESEIDINKHIFKRDKKKKKKDRFDYKFISDDRVGKLTVHLKITLKETDVKTGETFIHTYPIKKSMLIPLQDEEGYFHIKGKKYYLIYQMVEKSTYTSNQSVTLKSLMPIAVKRNIIEESESLTNNITNEKLKSQGIDVVDVVGKSYSLPYYNVYVFRKEIPILLFYLAHGIDWALDFLEVRNVISFIDKLPETHDDKEYIYFQISSKCYLQANRYLFNKYTYIQSVVGGFLHVCNNRTTVESLDDRKSWIKKISNPNNYEKGKDILKFFQRLLDESTKKSLKISQYHKSDIYTLLRWIMQEFTMLRLKDNMDLNNKRIRCNEYAASLLTKEFSKRLNKIISLGDKATIDNFRDLFKFSGDILLQQYHSSGILRFDDNVNDMNFFSKFKYTTKGPHSVTNSRTFL